MKTRRVLWAVYATFVGVCLIIGHPSMVTAGLLNTVQSDFAATTAGMYQTSATWSQRIFYTVAACELFYTLFEGALFTQTIEAWINTFTHRLFLFGCGLWLVTNQVAVGQWFVTEVQTISGAFSPTTQTPDAIVQLGYNLSDVLSEMNPAKGGLLDKVALALPQVLAGTALQIAFLFVGIEMLMANIAVQLCVALGSILLGFVGSRWTRSFAAMWSRMVVTTLLLLVTVNAIAGIGLTLDHDLMNRIVSIGSPGTSVSLAITTLMADSFVYILFALGISGLVGFLGATTPMSGANTAIRDAAMGAFGAVVARMAFAAGRGGGGGEASSSIGKIEAATKLPSEAA